MAWKDGRLISGAGHYPNLTVKRDSEQAGPQAGGEGGPRAHKRAAVNKKIKVDKQAELFSMGIYKKG